MYNKALDIQRKMPAALERSRQILGLAPDDPFPGKEWLLQETDYLQNLSKEPPEETLLMEYCKRLQTLWDCEYVPQIRYIQPPLTLIPGNSSQLLGASVLR